MSSIKKYLDVLRLVKHQSEVLAKITDKEERAQIAQLPVLVLELARAVPLDELATLSDRARSLFDPGLLLDIRVNPDLIGGARVSWKGVYYDGSIKNILEERKGEIRKIIWSRLNTI